MAQSPSGPWPTPNLPPHPSRLRQLALITPTPLFPHTKHLLTSIFGISTTFTDPAVQLWGIENVLVPFGGDLIEVCTPLPSRWAEGEGTQAREKRVGTAVGRLLEKRRGFGQGKNGEEKTGEGGYMLILQTHDASQLRREIEGGFRGPKRPVIFQHEFNFTYPPPSPLSSTTPVQDSGYCIQYHPKGVPGGMMAEVDSHTPSTWNPMPLEMRFGPWHALGPGYGEYVKGMRGAGGLWVLGVTLRLAWEQGQGVQEALRVWREGFGIPTIKGVGRGRKEGGEDEEVAFTNARMKFVPGEKGLREGLVGITIGVEGRERLRGVVERASGEGVWRDEDEGTRERVERDIIGARDRAKGWIEMVGVRWYLVLMDEDGDDHGNLKARM